MAYVIGKRSGEDFCLYEQCWSPNLEALLQQVTPKTLPKGYEYLEIIEDFARAKERFIELSGYAFDAQCVYIAYDRTHIIAPLVCLKPDAAVDHLLGKAAKRSQARSHIRERLLDGECVNELQVIRAYMSPNLTLEHREAVSLFVKQVEKGPEKATVQDGTTFWRYEDGSYGNSPDPDDAFVWYANYEHLCLDLPVAEDKENQGGIMSPGG